MPAGSQTVRRRLLVDGVVQGVWFRASCRDEATARGVAGSASNLPDGRVSVVLEGPADAVAAVEAWCHDGPPGARVAAVDGHDEEPTGESGFRTG